MISRETDEQIKFFYKKSFNEMEDIEKQQIIDISLNHKRFNGQNTDATISEILEMPNLIKCTINGFDINDEDIMLLNKSKTLKEIQFSNCNFKNKNSSLRNLEALIIDNCKGNLKGIFERLQDLKFLHIIGCEMFDTGYIERCNKLKQLYIQDSNIKKVEAIRSLKELEYVNLNRSRFNQAAFALLKLNNKIEIVYDKDAQIKIV